MNNSMRSDDEVQYLLHEGAMGNGRCSFLAGLALAERGFSPFYVEAQLLRSAKDGYPPAKRWLGILGLCHLLPTDSSSFSAPAYHQDYGRAISLLKNAAAAKDKAACYILARCRQFGIGMNADELAGYREAERLALSLSRKELDVFSELFRYLRDENESGRLNSKLVLRYMLYLERSS